MRKNLIHVSVVAVCIALTACGEKTKDEKIEDLALPLYDKYVSDKNYCKAYEITQQRFEYATDYQTSNGNLARQYLKWQNRAKAVELDCRKQLWPKKEALLLMEIKKKNDLYEKYEDLMKFSISIPADSFGRDDRQRDCAYDLDIHNNSKLQIMGFAYEITSSDDSYYSGKGAYQLREGYPQESEYVAIAPKENRIARVCDFSIGGGDSKLRNVKIGLIPLNVRMIELESRETINISGYKKKESGYDFLSEIAALKKRIVDENPNTQ